MTESDSKFDIKTTVATRNAQICLESAGFSVTRKFQQHRSMTTGGDMIEELMQRICYDIVILHYFYDSCPELRALVMAEGLLGCPNLTGFIHLPVLLFFSDIKQRIVLHRGRTDTLKELSEKNNT